MKRLLAFSALSFVLASGSVFAVENNCGGTNDNCGEANHQQVKPAHVPEAIRILKRQVKNKERQLQRLHERGRITEKEYEFLSEKLKAYASHVDSATKDNQLTKEERHSLRNELKEYNMDLAEARHGKRDQEANFADEDGEHGAGQHGGHHGHGDLNKQHQSSGHQPGSRGGQQNGDVKTAL